MKPRRMRKLPPIQTWTENIDERTVAGIALAIEHRPQKTWTGRHVVRRLAIFRRSEFVIAERREGELQYYFRPRAEAEAREKLIGVCVKGGNSLEFAGFWENDEKA